MVSESRVPSLITLAEWRAHVGDNFGPSVAIFGPYHISTIQAFNKHGQQDDLKLRQRVHNKRHRSKIRRLCWALQSALSAFDDVDALERAILVISQAPRHAAMAINGDLPR